MWNLLRCIGSDEHILDVLPEMWPRTLAFFEQAAASPRQLIDGTLKLKLNCTREAKVTPRAQRAALDVKRIRKLVEGDALVERMVSAACTAMAKATGNPRVRVSAGRHLRERPVADHG
jgi:hypothetical protein